MNATVNSINKVKVKYNICIDNLKYYIFVRLNILTI